MREPKAKYQDAPDNGRRKNTSLPNRESVGEREPLLTPEQVAAFLGVSEKSLANWRWASGGPRFVKIRRLVRYRRSDVEAWLDRHSQRNTSEGGDHGER